MKAKKKKVNKLQIYIGIYKTITIKLLTIIIDWGDGKEEINIMETKM